MAQIKPQPVELESLDDFLEIPEEVAEPKWVAPSKKKKGMAVPVELRNSPRTNLKAAKPKKADTTNPMSSPEMHSTGVLNTDIPDLTSFVDEAFGHTHKNPNNWHHQLFYEILENKIIQGSDGLLYRADRHGLGRENKNILALAPRFHAKSQCFTVHYPIWEMYRNPNKRIMIVSANQEIATSFVRQIVNHLENNHVMIDKYGSLQPQPGDQKKWGEKAFIVERTSFDKDPSVAGIGIGGKIISKRADIIILDDIIDMDTARTPAMRQKTLDWFENVLLPVLEDNGRIVVAGTTWYKDDLYDYLFKHPSFDVKLKLKALIYHPNYIREDANVVRHLPYNLIDFPLALDAGTIFSPEIMFHYKLNTVLEGGVLWQEKWDFDKLMEKKAGMSPGAFMRQYLNEPTSADERLFSERSINDTLQLGNKKSLVSTWDNSSDGVSHHFGYGNLVIAVGVDLAISKKKTADKSAIAVWGLDDRRRRILLWLESGRWSPDETKQRVLDINERFNPVKIVVENVAYQDMIRQDLANDDVPVEGFRTTANKKYHEETGIAQISMLMEQGKVLIPNSKTDAETIRMVKEFAYDLAVYTYDSHAPDMLMASWFAFDALSDFDKKMKTNRGFFSTNALVEHLKSRRAANKVLLIESSPPKYRYAKNSLVSIFRDMENPKFSESVFFEPTEQFFIFCTRSERSLAYIIQKTTNEIVGKIEGGNISTMMFAQLLEKAGAFFNKAQVIVDNNDEGAAVLLEMQKRGYDNLMCLQPDRDGGLEFKEGFKISAQTLPLAVDHFKSLTDGLHVRVPDESLLKEMSDLIGVEGDSIVIGYGEGQRIKTVATALWLIDHYENDAKAVYNEGKKITAEQKAKKAFSGLRYNFLSK
jgi:hypothetical protein